MRFDTDRNHHISMDIYSLLGVLEKKNHSSSTTNQQISNYLFRITFPFFPHDFFVPRQIVN